MAARSLMALDYSNYHSNSILKKHAKNRPLGELEHRHNYVPAQPVLSCRTVQIDLPGTRTYRPKSTVDILEEQQRLIRSLYSKERSSVSAPPRQRQEPVGRAVSQESHRRINIEVKGRPLTSLSQTTYPADTKVTASVQRRPKTTGRLKNVQPATDCFMVVKVDKDFLATSQSNRELTNKIHSHWKSENNNLAVGKFVRGQKRPDDVPPTLDAWLTFGGAAGDTNEGVIDAFANFKNSEEYYNIEGSVGSRVAHQLQKGGKIRIGINGVLQSEDLKVKRWNKENLHEDRDQPEHQDQTDHNIVEEVVAAEQKKETEEEIEEEAEQVKEEQEQTLEESEDQEAKESPKNDTFDEFKELDIGGLDDLLEDTMESDKEPKSPPVTKLSQPVAPPQPSQPMTIPRKAPAPEPEPVVRELPKKIIPLSWDDQCSKPDVKVINAKITPREVFRPVMSETHPVKFEKLINGSSRPKLAQAKSDGFKVKQRPVNLPKDGRGGSSKVRAFYIDPLSLEDEEKVNKLSVDEILNNKLEGRSRESTSTSLRLRGESQDNNIMAINEDNNPSFQPQRTGSTKGGHKNSRPNSNYSLHSSDHGRINSPKLKTIPIHSAANQAPGDLSIMSTSRNMLNNELGQRTVKTPGRISPAKPLHRSGAGLGSSIKAGPLQGETEYIKIASKMKGAPGSAPASTTSHVPYHFSPGSNTPRDLLDHDDDFGPEVDTPKTKSPVYEQDRNSNKVPSRGHTPSSNHEKKDNNDNIDDVENEVNVSRASRASSALSDSPAPTTVAISIPTADELSDKESPDHSPARYDEKMTATQRREREMRDEQIDQITDLLGGAITKS